MTVQHCAVTALIGGSTTSPVIGTTYIHQEGLGMMEPGAVVTTNTAATRGMDIILLRLMTPQPVLTSQIKCLPSIPHADSSIDSSVTLTEKFGVLVGLTRNQGENVIIWKKFLKIKKLTKFVILMDVRIAV